MKVVYVAGPFRASTGWGIEENVRYAELHALHVWRAGAACLCPHMNSRHFNGVLPDKTFLDGDLELLLRCDAVLLLPNWAESDGTIDEVIFAIRHGIPVFQYFVSLKLWLEYGTHKEIQSALEAKAIQLREARRAKAGAGA
jgi:nucleoside 2-deoxyribosyltransferase